MLFKGSVHDGYHGNNDDFKMEQMVYEDILKSFRVGMKAPTIPTKIPLTRE